MIIKGSVAIVTGGASGLGEATVTSLVENGAKAIIFDMDQDRGNAIVEKFGTDQVQFVKANVTDEVEVQNGINAGIDKFGLINVVVNCAGTGVAAKTIGRDNKAHSLSDFSRVIQVNLIGTFNVLRLAAEKMVLNAPNESGERGVIINTASIAAFDGQMGQAAYSASKGGMVGMTLPIARDLAQHGIRIMTIAPGLFHTPAVDKAPKDVLDALGASVPFPHRLGRPHEFAMLVQNIIENPYFNGETIRLDGALRMAPK